MWIHYVFSQIGVEFLKAQLTCFDTGIVQQSGREEEGVLKSRHQRVDACESLFSLAAALELQSSPRLSLLVFPSQEVSTEFVVKNTLEGVFFVMDRD